MSKRFNLYVPSELSFHRHFKPLLEQTDLESFEADHHRFGIQRKGNTHLVVFFEHSLTLEPSQFLQVNHTGRFGMENSQEKALFEKVFGSQKEVSVFSIFYTSRMTPLAWRLLIEIADDPRVLVMDEARHFMPGPDYARDLRELLV
jgi:hypothetical protein